MAVDVEAQRLFTLGQGDVCPLAVGDDGAPCAVELIAAGEAEAVHRAAGAAVDARRGQVGWADARVLWAAAAAADARQRGRVAAVGVAVRGQGRAEDVDLIHQPARSPVEADHGGVDGAAPFVAAAAVAACGADPARFADPLPGGVDAHTERADAVHQCARAAVEAHQRLVGVAAQVVAAAAAAADDAVAGFAEHEAAVERGLCPLGGGEEGVALRPLAGADQRHRAAGRRPAIGFEPEADDEVAAEALAQAVNGQALRGAAAEADGLPGIALDTGGGAVARRGAVQLGGVGAGVAELGAARCLVQLVGEAAAVDQLTDFAAVERLFVDAQIVEIAVEEVVLHVVAQVAAAVRTTPTAVVAAVDQRANGDRAQPVVGVGGVAAALALLVAVVLFAEVDGAVGVALRAVAQRQLAAHAGGVAIAHAGGAPEGLRALVEEHVRFAAVGPGALVEAAEVDVVDVERGVAAAAANCEAVARRDLVGAVLQVVRAHVDAVFEAAHHRPVIGDEDVAALIVGQRQRREDLLTLRAVGGGEADFDLGRAEEIHHRKLQVAIHAAAHIVRPQDHAFAVLVTKGAAQGHPAAQAEAGLAERKRVTAGGVPVAAVEAGVAVRAHDDVGAAVAAGAGEPRPPADVGEVGGVGLALLEVEQEFETVCRGKSLQLGGIAGVGIDQIGPGPVAQRDLVRSRGGRRGGDGDRAANVGALLRLKLEGQRVDGAVGVEDLCFEQTVGDGPAQFVLDRGGEVDALLRPQEGAACLVGAGGERQDFGIEGARPRVEAEGALLTVGETVAVGVEDQRIRGDPGALRHVGGVDVDKLPARDLGGVAETVAVAVAAVGAGAVAHLLVVGEAVVVAVRGQGVEAAVLHLEGVGQAVVVAVRALVVGVERAAAVGAQAVAVGVYQGGEGFVAAPGQPVAVDELAVFLDLGQGVEAGERAGEDIVDQVLAQIEDLGLARFAAGEVIEFVVTAARGDAAHSQIVGVVFAHQQRGREVDPRRQRDLERGGFGLEKTVAVGVVADALPAVGRCLLQIVGLVGIGSGDKFIVEDAFLFDQPIVVAQEHERAAVVDGDAVGEGERGRERVGRVEAVRVGDAHGDRHRLFDFEAVVGAHAQQPVLFDQPGIGLAELEPILVAHVHHGDGAVEEAGDGGHGVAHDAGAEALVAILEGFAVGVFAVEPVFDLADGGDHTVDQPGDDGKGGADGEEEADHKEEQHHNRRGHALRQRRLARHRVRAEDEEHHQRGHDDHGGHDHRRPRAHFANVRREGQRRFQPLHGCAGERLHILDEFGDLLGGLQTGQHRAQGGVGRFQRGDSAFAQADEILGGQDNRDCGRQPGKGDGGGADPLGPLARRQRALDVGGVFHVFAGEAEEALRQPFLGQPLLRFFEIVEDGDHGADGVFAQVVRARTELVHEAGGAVFAFGQRAAEVGGNFNAARQVPIHAQRALLEAIHVDLLLGGLGQLLIGQHTLILEISRPDRAGIDRVPVGVGLAADAAGVGVVGEGAHPHRCGRFQRARSHVDLERVAAGDTSQPVDLGLAPGDVEHGGVGELILVRREDVVEQRRRLLCRQPGGQPVDVGVRDDGAAGQAIAQSRAFGLIGGKRLGRCLVLTQVEFHQTAQPQQLVGDVGGFVGDLVGPFVEDLRARSQILFGGEGVEVEAVVVAVDDLLFGRLPVDAVLVVAAFGQTAILVGAVRGDDAIVHIELHQPGQARRVVGAEESCAAGPVEHLGHKVQRSVAFGVADQGGGQVDAQALPVLCPRDGHLIALQHVHVEPFSQFAVVAHNRRFAGDRGQVDGFGGG